jgi:RHS repeat-associated protein
VHVGWRRWRRRQAATACGARPCRPERSHQGPDTCFLLARRARRDGQTYYLTFDQVGSLRAVFDASGALAERVDYDAFGNVTSDTDPSFAVPIGFAGGLADTDTGRVHFGARDYDPTLGRFTTRDPAGLDGGDTNLYAYCAGDPVNGVDPSGLLHIGNLYINCGEKYGQQATDDWATKSIQPNNTWYQNAFYTTMGMLSALWTPATSDKTMFVLTAALGVGQLIRGLGGAGAAGAAEAAAAQEGLAGSAAREMANEGIYVIRSSRGDYVGQSGNIAQRLAQHVGRFTREEVAAAERYAVQGGKTAREIAEQLKIDELGGIGRLLNQRNPIGLARLHLMPPGYVRP